MAIALQNSSSGSVPESQAYLIVDAVAKELDCCPSSLSHTEKLVLDSLSSMNVLLEIEAITGLDIPDEDYLKLTTLEEIFAYVQSHTS